MNKSVYMGGILLAAILCVRADDATVKTVMENPNSTKSSQGPSTGPIAPRDLTPENLRDNPAYDIPFPQPASGFRDNPNPDPIKIGPLPDALRPMGDNKTMVKPTMTATTSGKDEGSVDIPARPVVEIPQATEKTPAAGTSQETVTASPFLDWIQNTKNATEVAKQQREAIEQNDSKDKGAKDGTDQDLFLHIRFPYVGNQDLPPGGGSVTYSVPQR